MVFLHPTILRDPETADFYSRSKYDDLRGAQLGLFDQDEDFNQRIRPTLPELHMYFQGQRVTNQANQFNTILPTSNAIKSVEPKLVVDPSESAVLSPELQLETVPTAAVAPAAAPAVVPELGQAVSAIETPAQDPITTLEASASLDAEMLERQKMAASLAASAALLAASQNPEQPATSLIASASLESDLIGSDDASID